MNDRQEYSQKNKSDRQFPEKDPVAKGSSWKG